VLRVLMFAAVLLVVGGPVQAAERVRVGILELTSSAPIELTFLQAAAPIATALAAGQIDVGATGLTAALYNIVLGGERIRIVADKGREWPGYPLTAIVVQKDLWDAGVRAVRDLKGRRIGVTQLGSTFHYQLGKWWVRHGFMKATIPLREIVDTSFVEAAIKALGE